MYLRAGVDERSAATAVPGAFPPLSAQHHDHHQPMTEHHRVIYHRWALKHLEKHREVLEKHKDKGPFFAQAVEALERTINAN